MIIKEYYKTREDGVKLFRARSDKGVKIQKVVVNWNGKRITKEEFYSQAIDVDNAPYEYVETNIPVEESR